MDMEFWDCGIRFYRSTLRTLRSCYDGMTKDLGVKMGVVDEQVKDQKFI